MSTTQQAQLVPQYELISRLMETVRLDDAALTQLPRCDAIPGALTAGLQPPTSGTVSVPAETALRSPDRLDAVLEERSSDRFYDNAAVALEDLTAVLKAATEHDEAAWPGESVAGLGLDLLVAASRVDGLGRALYRLHDGRFEPVADLPPALDELVLQIEFAHAPAIIVVVVPFAGLLRRWDDHGERIANLRSGGAIGAALLEAQARGLAASPFAGFLASALGSLVNVDGYERAQLFAASFGYPATLPSVG